MDRFKFLKKIRQRWFTLSFHPEQHRRMSKGFTLIEVLVSIGLLSTMVMVVAYMTVSNQNEILRNNAETYADLIASDQFSSLVAYRNQKVFDLDPTTNWNNDLYKKIGSNSYYIDNLSGQFKLEPRIGDAIKPLMQTNGSVDLKYFMQFSKMNDANGSENTNLIKVHLRVSYRDRGGITRYKNYYTVLGNYLGSQ
jgi:prepilin-type N-terminal cleavage/methylation domain-containing protein